MDTQAEFSPINTKVWNTKKAVKKMRVKNKFRYVAIGDFTLKIQVVSHK